MADNDSREAPKREAQHITVYQFNDQIGDFEELIIDPDVQLSDLLDDDFILLFVDPQHYRVWLWHGFNTTTRMKFIAAKMTAPIRDKHGIAFKITTEDQGTESHSFKVMLGLEEEIDYSEAQTGPTYVGSEEDFELLADISREKILLIIEKGKIPEDHELKMVIVQNQIYGYQEYERDYLGTVIKEKQLFPLTEEVDDGMYLMEKYIPRILMSFNKVVLIELLQKIEKPKQDEKNNESLQKDEVDDSIKKKKLKLE